MLRCYKLYYDYYVAGRKRNRISVGDELGPRGKCVGANRTLFDGDEAIDSSGRWCQEISGIVVIAQLCESGGLATVKYLALDCVAKSNPCVSGPGELHESHPQSACASFWVTDQICLVASRNFDRRKHKTKKPKQPQ